MAVIPIPGNVGEMIVTGISQYFVLSPEAFLARENLATYFPSPLFELPAGNSWDFSRSQGSYICRAKDWVINNGTFETRSTQTSIGTSIYIDFDIFNELLTLEELPDDVPQPANAIALQNDSYIYYYSTVFRYGAYPPLNTAILNLNKPNYKSLVSGYSLDERTIPSQPRIVPVVTKTVKIAYYKWNRLENTPSLKSIIWMTYKCHLVAGVQYTLPIEDCVLGCLTCDDDSVLEAIFALPTISGKYPWNALYLPAIEALFATWNALYDATNDNPTNATIFPEERLLRKIAANNNVWNNGAIGNDINPDPLHPMFTTDLQRTYEYHLLPQPDGSFGTLIMDSPRTIEIHAALDAGKFATDPATNEPRVANLGHLIERVASLLGYRPEPNGTFTKAAEQSRMRTVIDSKTALDPTKVGVNNFGEQGMVVRRLNNRFDGDKVMANECVVVYDLLQLLAEYQDQLNLALNLQESSAIEIKGKNSTAKYSSQLELMTELLNLATNNHDAIRAALVSSLVAQAQTSEIIAALGLPVITKTLPIQMDNKVEQLPYEGVAPHRSVSQEIATCTQNVGIVLGQLI